MIKNATIKASSFDELMMKLLQTFRNPDFICSPRGSEIKELIVPTLVLTDPRNRLLYNKERKANYGFGVGEFLWYWRGSNSLEEMTYYNKRMPSFSDDSKTVNSAYGSIMQGKNDACKFNQWKLAKDTLRNDPDSRRAVVQIHQPLHQKFASYGSKDVPCTLSLQFFIRENRLYLHTNMRSNDVIWGLTYDLFSFTLFQECMLLELKGVYHNLELGDYIHTVGSLHIYEYHYEMTEKMLNINTAYHSSMEPLSSLDDLDTLMALEIDLRQSKNCKKRTFDNGTIQWMANRLYEHRRKRDKK